MRFRGNSDSRRAWLGTLGLISLCCAGAAWPRDRANAGDQPQFGEAWSRNMISTEKGLPDSFDPATRRNVNWVAELGTETHSTPVVAGGRIYIGTNNGHPRDPKHGGDRGVLMCFEEQTGRFLWQLVVPKREEDIYLDWPQSGIASSPSVEGDRIYVVSNRGEVLCLDANGMANGNDGPFRAEGTHMTRRTAGDTSTPDLAPGPLDADIVWLFDLTAGAGIWSHDAAHSSILIHGDYLYLNTGTGVDNTHRNIRTPEAPSLVVLDKHTGRLVAREREVPALNIFHSTWAGPSMGEVAGSLQLFFAAGNGMVYGFDPRVSNGPRVDSTPPDTLRKIWQFDFDPDSPKTNVHKYVTNRRESPSNFYGMPVFYRDRLYVAGGGDIWWGKNQAWLKCIDPSGTGTLTTNAVAWSCPLQEHVLSTPAIADGLVFIADCGPTLHCVDAASGRELWTHPLKGEVWASPLVADGKVHIGTRSGLFCVLAASREKKLLSTIELGKPISGTVTAANGVVYLATMNQLYALRAEAPAR